MYRDYLPVMNAWCLFDTELGRMAVVLVGAMIVAGIETVATGKVKPSGRIELNIIS